MYNETSINLSLNYFLNRMILGKVIISGMGEREKEDLHEQFCDVRFCFFKSLSLKIFCCLLFGHS